MLGRRAVRASAQAKRIKEIVEPGLLLPNIGPPPSRGNTGLTGRSDPRESSRALFPRCLQEFVMMAELSPTQRRPRTNLTSLPPHVWGDGSDMEEGILPGPDGPRNSGNVRLGKAPVPLPPRRDRFLHE